ncbi:MAG: septum formation protein Maf [Paludibacteraceae bacterium]|nr:septum formation protein Maf [Paludibacteraceae bacterium]MBQ8704692.1 septum formation protein Maf [Paludibacteraceae bacterium]
MNSQFSIILGSQSPRRRELLAGLDIPFTAVSIDADETYPSDLQAGDIPYYISRAKARAYESRLGEDQLLITSDTIVWADGKMLGKPHDEAEAFAMLRSLSGKTHQVYTAVTFAEKISSLEGRSGGVVTLVDKTDVTFKELTDEEIRYYIDRYKPFDKAGAYGIQEWIGYIGCTAISGSYFNVMGFPVHLVYRYLDSRGLI